jgi:DNA polymerase-3 subunit gamma/tau
MLLYNQSLFNSGGIMSYTALYREWRPLVFEDVVEQEHIVKTLKYSVTAGRIAHAYLFCGTRGTGKTTMAHILSRAINCLNPQNGDPCNECEVCKGILEGSILDVLEIDAASNNSVDNVREIRDEVIYAPSTARYKVYIIDEVHMLSTGAFNALLKTLEEPPSHVVFILATTEPHKLPATILSRCQRFDFRKISVEGIVQRLDKVAHANGITFEKEALRLISRLADGALRDALSIMDQCMSLAAPRCLTKTCCL